METNGYPVLAALPVYAASQLLHDLDTCNAKVAVGIEKYHWTDKLLGFTFGDVKRVSLMGVVNLE